MKRTINAEQKTENAEQKNLTQYLTTPTSTLIQNYFGFFDTIQYPHSIRSTTLHI